MLKMLLRRLYNDAKLNPAQPRRRTLDHGLRVDMLLLSDKLRLQISRPNTFPSDQEWTTIMQCLPWTTSNRAPPDKMEHNTRYYLRTSFLIKN